MSQNPPVAGSPPTVTVYWRPGCGFCMALRRQLERQGIAHDLVNVWEDPEGSAAVRAVNRGNELVPTVAVGDRWLSNPSARQVLDALAADA